MLAPSATQQHHETCEALGHAVDSGTIGKILAKHERLILQYYEDVLEQVQKSFSTAKRSAIAGFIVLIGTVIFALVFDALNRLGKLPAPTELNPDVAWTPLITVVASTLAGIVIEGVAALAFVLYGRTARQFAAFHICLERTHRYLLAYKMANDTKENKDETIRDLVCLMANAPMIGQADINADASVRQSRELAGSLRATSESTRTQPVA
jgi:hypothetical protein